MVALAETGNEDNLNIRTCDVTTNVEGDLYSSGTEDSSGMPYVIRCFRRGKSNLKTVLESSKHLLSENICCPNFFW